MAVTTFKKLRSNIAEGYASTRDHNPTHRYQLQLRDEVFTSLNEANKHLGEHFLPYVGPEDELYKQIATAKDDASQPITGLKKCAEGAVNITSAPAHLIWLTFKIAVVELLENIRFVADLIATVLWMELSAVGAGALLILCGLEDIGRDTKRYIKTGRTRKDFYPDQFPPRHSDTLKHFLSTNSAFSFLKRFDWGVEQSFKCHSLLTGMLTLITFNIALLSTTSSKIALHIFHRPLYDSFELLCKTVDCLKQVIDGCFQFSIGSIKILTFLETYIAKIPLRALITDVMRCPEVSILEQVMDWSRYRNEPKVTLVPVDRCRISEHARDEYFDEDDSGASEGVVARSPIHGHRSWNRSSAHNSP